MAIINGRRVTNVPGSGVYGQDIIDEMDVSQGRRPVFMKPGGFEQIQPGKRYSKREVLDKKGRPVKVSDIPDRTKGDSDDPILW